MSRWELILVHAAAVAVAFSSCGALGTLFLLARSRRERCREAAGDDGPGLSPAGSRDVDSPPLPSRGPNHEPATVWPIPPSLLADFPGVTRPATRLSDFVEVAGG